MKVAVIGGTGTVGRHVVAQLIADGHEALVITRSRGVDIRTGAGLAGSLTGAQALIDVSGAVQVRSSSAIAFGQTVTRNLVAEAQRAGLAHYVAISIVGIDRVAYPYYKGKLAQEETLLKSGLPATIVRVTQFHELPGQILSRMPPLAPIPRVPVRPISAAAAGRELARIVVGEPIGFAPELAGPQQEDFADMAKRLMQDNRERHIRPGKRVVALTPRWSWIRAMADGGLLPQNIDGRLIVTGPTFSEWLAARHQAAEL